MHYLQEIIRAQKEPRWPCEKCAQCAREWQQGCMQHMWQAGRKQQHVQTQRHLPGQSQTYLPNMPQWFFRQK